MTREYFEFLLEQPYSYLTSDKVKESDFDFMVEYWLDNEEDIPFDE